MIGIFDAGLGGLAVLRELQGLFPAVDFLYFGDTAGGPYDDKSPGLVAARLADGLNRLVDAGAALLVVADHGAAACLTAEIRQRFSVPVLDILTHGVVPAVAALAPASLGILGPAIVESAGAHRRAVGDVLPKARIYTAAAPLLAPLVDARWLNKPEAVMIVKKYLHFFKLRQVEALVPASNHYLHLGSILQRKMGKRVTIVSPVSALAQAVTAVFTDHPEVHERCAGSGSCNATVSDLTDGMEKDARLFYGKNIRLTQA
jgi:glutamate racemase